MSALYSASKIFHFRPKLEDLLTGNRSAPIHVRLKPTNRCNHRCVYCCYRNDHLYLSESMNEDDEIPVDKMKRIVDDLQTMGVKAVTFSGGGEPLCYPAICETTEDLLVGGIKVAVLTNGSLLKGRISRVLGEGASWVRVSMDGASAESYAAGRGVGDGEFDKVCTNIRDFAKTKRRDCQLGVNFIATSDNHREVFKFLKIMKELGVDHVKISEAVVSVKASENIDYVSSFFSSLRDRIAEGISLLADDTFAVIDKVIDCADPSEAGDGYEKTYSWCPFIQCLTVIAADQNCYTCQDKAYSKNGMLGTIRDGRFKELWFDDETGQRLMSLDPSRECRHHCVAHEKNRLLHDFLEADPSHLAFI